MATTRRDKQGVSLAKGPAGLIGLGMIAWGVIHFLSGGNSFSASPPDGTVTGDSFLGLTGNGWTNVLWAGGGLLLAFGAPLHWGAKTMSLLVAIVLGAAALVGASDGSSVFGIFATDGQTQLAQAAVAVALAIVALLPRVGRKREVVRHDDEHHHAERTGRFRRDREADRTLRDDREAGALRDDRTRDERLRDERVRH
jgi:hypothetical protein